MRTSSKTSSMRAGVMVEPNGILSEWARRVRAITMCRIGTGTSWGSGAEPAMKWTMFRLCASFTSSVKSARVPVRRPRSRSWA